MNIKNRIFYPRQRNSFLKKKLWFPTEAISAPAIVLAILIGLQCSPSIPTVRPIQEGKEKSFCQKVRIAPGPEDIELIQSSTGNPYLVVSTHERRIPDQDGKLYSISLDKKSMETGNFLVEPLDTPEYPRNFKPHGISHSKFQGKNRLYVISHPGLNLSNPEKTDSLPRHTIEVWEETPGSPGRFQWKHTKTLQDETLESPNDLFALSEERLLISNDMGSELNLTAVVNLLFKRATSDITYYADGKFYKTKEKLSFGNGIWYEEKTKESGTLYRASHIDQSIFVYSAKWVENHPPLLELQYKVAFPGGPDNLFKNEYGFFTSIHPSNLKFMGHANSSEKVAPSQVFEIVEKNKTRLVYSDRGEEISAASGAIRYKNKLFISQVFEDYLLVCDI